MISANLSAFSVGKAVGRGGGALPYLLDILVVAGGGGGGGWYWSGGGGGAGGMQTLSGITPITNTNYTVTVGAGGPSKVDYSGTSERGSNTSISGTGITTTTGNGGGEVRQKDQIIL